MNEILQADGDETGFRPKPDGLSDPAGEAGWFLQRERERRGLSLEMISSVLGIHDSHLAGLENGDLSKLPSRREALAMLGVYGEYLGFDPVPLTRHYAQFLPRPLVGNESGQLPRPLSSAKIIPFTMALKLAMSTRGLKIVGSIIGVLFLFHIAGMLLFPAGEADRIASGTDPLPTATLQAEADDGSLVRVKESPLSEDTALNSTASQTMPANETVRLEGGLDDLTPFISEQLGGTGDLPQIPTKAKTNEILKEGLPQTHQSAVTNGAARIVLRASGTVWFRVDDSQGNVIVSQTLIRGETYPVPNRDDLVIIARDGGMLTYMIDGVERGALGTPGEIVVGRPLSVSNLMDSRG